MKLHSNISYILSRFLFILFIFIYQNTIVIAQDEEEQCKVDNKKAEKIFEQGVNSMKSGKRMEAVKYFKQTIEVEPAYVDAYYALGKIYLNEQKHTETSTIAITGSSYLPLIKKYYRKVVELCPDYDISCYYTLGDIYLGNNKLDSAVYYFSEFMKDPDKIKNSAQYDHADSVVTYVKTIKEIRSKEISFHPVYVKGISSKLDEYLPLISPDNEMALFVRKIKLPASKDVTWSQEVKYQEKFMYSLRTDNGEFNSGNEMPYPFNTTENEGAATITLDNKTLYFVFCQYLKDHSYYNCDICESHKKNDDSWSEIKNLGPKVNGEKTWESQPSISSDGKTLYFISDRPGGYGGYDIWSTTKDSSGNWMAPVNLGPNINTAGNEKTPYIHTDNKTLYFSSTGWPGLGGYDVFYSRKDKNGKWGKAKNIGYPINTEGDEVGYTISTDGHYGYFASNDTTKFKGPGGYDVYSFDLYPEARPDTVLLIKGNVKDVIKNEPTSAKVQLKNVATKQVTEIPVDSMTGKYIAATLFHDDYLLTVKKNDYAYTSKYIAKDDTAFSNAPTKVKIDFEVKPIAVGESYKLNDIYFAYGEYNLTSQSKIIIDDFVDYLKGHPTMKVAIYGHTDNISGAEFNQKLSENRAKAVYDYMIENGIDASRLSHKGFGLTKPVASNDTEEGRAKNRRTEFVIIEK